ncbi:MAG TPA: glycosyltransferase [Candidatus Paceibacterota bacterium]|nr:glycosyltransferase [Verrucomicrobiota bacterium]HSA11122.1 glycosyltransferase [Candidatus Paceibacterota bacterium]
MKLLVFAHTPPPHHGQSYMVQLMLEGFGGNRRRPNQAAPVPNSPGPLRIECYHVNARLSRKLEDIGDLRFNKLLLLLGYCLQAIWCRFRYGVTNFYYIPAPGKRSAIYRDWLVMLLCRRFFKRVILHWHAAGLAKWLELVVTMRWRTLTYWLMKQVDLSIVLSKYNRADAEKLFSRQIRVVSNGIPDPCPRFADEVWPRRKARFAARRKLLAGQALDATDADHTGGEPQLVRILYLAHCTREKGLFDSMDAVALANQRLRQRQAAVSLRLIVAGGFVAANDKTEFDRRLAEPGIADIVQYLGFVSGEQKHQLLREADLFCFPTYYENENQPVNLIEAMAFGLPILTTRWRSLPELFPVNYPGLVSIRSPEQLAEGLLALLTTESGEGFRDIFVQTYTLERHLAGLAEAFTQVESAHPAAMPAAAIGSLPK